MPSLLQRARFAQACLNAVVRQIEALGPSIEPPPITPEQRLEAAARAVQRFLASQTQRVTTGTIRRGVRLNFGVVGKALRKLQQEGTADCVPGPRRAMLWCVTRSLDAGIETESRNHKEVI